LSTGAEAIYPIADWDDAYANAPYIHGAADYPARWSELAAAFRERLSRAGRARIDLPYGPAPRNTLDLFYPDGACGGLVVFVHGGYWKAFDKSFWSHLAHGPLALGQAVAMPSYSLCPEARLAGIAMEVAAAVEYAAKEISGPIALCGHSAGGHLATRMICRGSPLGAGAAARISRIASISGVHDLRPLMATKMNDVLCVDDAEARSESPALLMPRAAQTVVCWVGADERPEFLRQSRILAEMWKGFDTRMTLVAEPGRHHFNVIEGLGDATHQLTRLLLG
jgi:arylformamidase